MDFSEALTETSITQEILESLTEFFTSENCLSLEVIFSGISKLTKNITPNSNKFINFFIYTTLSSTYGFNNGKILEKASNMENLEL